MMILRILTILAVLGALSTPAQARSKSWLDWILTPKMPDFERPIMLDGKTPHPQSWHNDQWSPENWTAARGTDKGVMDDLYASGIITDQYEEDGMPVLEVGPRFLQLSHSDQSKVASYVDDVFGITRLSEDGGFNIIYDPSDTVIGYYNAGGLVLE